MGLLLLLLLLLLERCRPSGWCRAHVRRCGVLQPAA
jgi:hypothetical protein